MTTGRRFSVGALALATSTACLVAALVLGGCERSEWDKVQSRLDRIEAGMTYQEVVDALGCPGEKQPDDGDVEAYFYFCYGMADGTIWAVFEDGRLIDKGFVGFCGN